MNENRENDHVLMVKHGDNPNAPAIMFYTGSKEGANKYKGKLEREDVKKNLKYEIKPFTQYLKDLK